MNRKIVTGLKYGLALLFIAAIVGIYFEVKDPDDLRQFRRADMPYPTNSQDVPSRKGLEKLRVSGSSCLKLPFLKKALADVKGPIYIIDLLEEPHCFINGLPARWYGYKSSDLLANVFKKPDLFQIRFILRRFLRTGKIVHTSADVQTEKQIVENAGYNYINLSYARGDIPTNDRVDQIVHFLTHLPENSWIHVHCSAGKGRTTVVMTMYDIIKNGKELPLDQIAKRQYLLRGTDIFDTRVWPNGTYTKSALENRKGFIVLFYQYVNDPKGFGVTPWIKWIKAKGITGDFESLRQQDAALKIKQDNDN